jgi:hypothetical protein
MQKLFKIKPYLATLFFMAILFSSISLTFADDDEEDDDDDDDRPKTSESTKSSSSGSGSTKTETKVTTDVSTKTIIEKDGDGDGLLDQNDPYPNIPEIYIVIDENKNGIVDQFEKQQDEKI